MAGFEGADHRYGFGEPLDLVGVRGHLTHLEEGAQRLGLQQMRTLVHPAFARRFDLSYPQTLRRRQRRVHPSHRKEVSCLI